MAKGAYIGVLTQQATLADVTEGSTVKVNENGSPVEFYVAKHDYEPTLNGSGRTLLVRKDVYSKSAWSITGTNTYATSTIDAYANSDYKNVLDDTVRSAIGETVFYYTVGNGSNTVTTLSRSVFILSFTELGQSTSYTNVEGSALPIASKLMSVSYNGSASDQWSRSARKSDTTRAAMVDLDGKSISTQGIGLTVGFRPCFTLPSNVGVGSDGLITGDEAEWKSVARKIKKGYIGIENVARKIKKAYIGIGGVARPCWSGGELAYYGTIAGLKTAVMAHSATSNGTHAIFAGGMPSGATATAYDASLTQTFPSYFDSMYLSSASAAGYSIFGFGATSSGSELTTAQRYDSSLTLTSHSGRQKRKVSGATSIGEFVIFAGGGYGNAATTQNVEFFHAPSMTNGSLATLNYPSYRMGATSVGDYAIFAGGADAQVNASYVKYVVAYDLSTTKTNLTDLSVAKCTLGAATVGDYALFAGGNTKSSSSNTVDAYNKSLTRTSAPTLSAAWSDMGATTIGDYAVFAGGSVSGSGLTAKAECYDASLTRTSLPSLSVSRYDAKAATIGNYALFGGGSNGNYQSVVDAYTIA